MPPPAETFASRFILGPALRTQPDRRLVTLVREGYENAFEEIVRRYGRPLTRYAAAIVGGRAEDVTQDAFSKALLALRRDGAEIELRPWLFRIVRNTALNDLRDSPPSPEVLAEAIADGRNPAEELERREELTDLMQRLQSLPEPQRAAIVMREMEGLSHEEIAAALGVSGGAARQAIHRARQALRDGLGLLLPLPLVRLLIDHGSEAAVAGAGAGGAAAAGGALGGTGAGVALKAGVVTAVLAGSVGTGIALHDRGHRNSAASAATASQAVGGGGAGSTAVASGGGSSPETSGRGDDHGRGGSGEDDSEHDDRGPGEGSNSGPGNRIDSGEELATSGGPGPGPATDQHHGQHGSREDDHGESRGPRLGGRGGGDDGEGSHSGPGPSGSHSSGGHSGPERGDSDGRDGESSSSYDDSSGPGPRGDDSSSGELAPPPPPAEDPPDEEELGSGSSGPGSGSGSSGGPGRNDELP
jgi:RNA polymerase sigma factor (sigma-70 family)